MEEVDVNPAGQPGNNVADKPAVSGDGRFVAFESYSTDLVAGDTNGLGDVFVRDRDLGTTERVDLTSTGAQATSSPQFAASAGSNPAISADGTVIAFESGLGLVPGAPPGGQVYVRDRGTATTELISGSVSSQYQNFDPAVSADGRFVAFIAIDFNVSGKNHIFVYDRQLGTTTQVDITTTGSPSAGGVVTLASQRPSLSADGRFVAFASIASDLVPGDTHAASDVFVRDVVGGTTEQVSIDGSGVEANGESSDPSISADGSSIAFGSRATNIVSPAPLDVRERVYVHNRMTGTTTLESVDDDSVRDGGIFPRLSGDGRYVAFLDENGQIWIRDLQGATTALTPAGDQNEYLDLSADGSRLAYADQYVHVDSLPTSAPTASIVRPADGFKYPLGILLIATYACSSSNGATIVTCEGTVPNGSPIDTSSPGDKTFSVTATDSLGNSFTTIRNYSIDGSFPVVTLTTPADGAYVGLHEGVLADYSCADVVGGSGLDSCRGPVENGLPIDTTTAGTKSFSVTATDFSGNATTVTHSYTVVAPVTVSGTVPAGGGTVSTDPAGVGPTPSAPLDTTVSSPNGGNISLNEHEATQTTPSGFTLLNLQMDITAPPASADAPLTLVFDIDAALLPAGQTKDTISLLKDEALLSDCPGAIVVPAGVNACIAARDDAPSGGGDVRLTVIAISASKWNIATGSPKPPVVQPGAATVVEGNSGIQQVNVPVALSAVSALPVTVQWRTGDNTATAPSDYAAASGTLIFAPGQTTGTVAIVVNGDTTPEQDESLLVGFSNATNATVGGYYGLGFGTIQDDDRPGLAVDDVSITEGNSGTGNLTFTVSLSKPTAATVTSTYATADGTATAPSDYQAKTGTVTIAAGATSAKVMIPIVGDTIRESNETLTLSLTNPSNNARLIDPSGTGTIVNDD